MERKTMKVMDAREGGRWFVCVKDCTGAMNPYKLYSKYYVPGKGYRQRLVKRYANFDSVLCTVWGVYAAGK
jgi:hypothetical protein